MAAVLGLRGSGSFSSDERPKNWREMLLYLYPNGEAPLTALLSMLKSEGTDDPEYNWWEKRLPTQRMALNGALISTDTTFTLTSGAKDCTKGTILLHEVSGELVRVVSDPIVDTEIEVERSWGAVAAGSLDTATYLTVIGNVNEEGAKTGTPKSYSPTKLNNYTEIFRMPLYLTRTARKTKLRWDNRGPYREAKREALSLHSIEMEKAHIWGEAVETTGDKGMPMRMMGGILSFLSTNKGDQSAGAAGVNFQVNGLLDEPTLDNILEAIFRYGSNEKLALCGSAFVKAITTLGKGNGFLQMVPRDSVYGMKIIEYTSPQGTLMLKMHPLFNQHPVWRQNALILDVQNLVGRPLDDTMFIKNRQDNDEDAAKDEYLTETGLEVHFEETHAYIEGVTGGLLS